MRSATWRTDISRYGSVDGDRGDEHGDRLQRRGGDARQLVLEALAAVRVAELVQPLLERAGRRLHPRLGVVVEVPVLEREREPGVGRDALPVHRDAALAAALEPLDRLAVHVRAALERLHDVVQDRPAGQRGDLLEVGRVVADVVGRQRHLLHALVARGRARGRARGTSRRA